jgi:hypothetical protein
MQIRPHRRAQRTFRKCFIDAVDSEFHVAAHWKKGRVKGVASRGGGDSAKQIAVCARAFKPDMAAVLRECVNQNPVRFHMTVAAAGEVAPQRMVFVLQRQWFTVYQKIEDGFKSGQILAAFSGKLDIFLELVGAAEGSHMPKSA